MELKTCLQFDNESSTDSVNFNPELCLYLAAEELIIYAEGPFLLGSNEDSFPSQEFPSNIHLMQEIRTNKNEHFLLLILEEDNEIIVLDLKNKFKVLAQFTNILPFKIIKIRQSPQSKQVFLLTETSSLIQIENFVLFTRLSPELLKERFESRQVLKEFKFPSTLHTNDSRQKVADFIVLESQNCREIEFLTVGLQDQMISWWKLPEITESHESQPQHPNQRSILGIFFTPKSHHHEHLLKFSRSLNESDRSIDKIVTSSNGLALLQDTTHGRLLLLDSDNSLIIKTFKGYRNCSALIDWEKRKLLIWAGNRFNLEKWEKFPFGNSKSLLIEEAVDSLASFDSTEYSFQTPIKFEYPGNLEYILMKLTPAYISSTVPDASSVKTLTLRSKSIAHIDDISFCVNLARLDLSENSLRNGESLSGLKYCKGISWISVAKNQLKDLTHLTELKNLQVLNASYNELSELPWDSLSTLKSLKALILNNNQFTLFPPTATLPQFLDTIVLSHNSLKEFPVKMFRSLPCLTKLSCSNAQLFSLPDLSKCSELKEVRLASNKLNSLENIEKFIPLSIEILDIGHNLIRTRSQLQKVFIFKKLTSLNVRGNLSPEDDEEFFKIAQKELLLLRNFNGRSLDESKGRKKSVEFRLKPERQNRNVKVKFDEAEE